MSPIRIGFIGLSAPKTGMPVTGAWGQLAHLPAISAQPSLYQITALCNSSIAAAQAAIAGHNLPTSTKTYDDPVALAHDPDVDLVVVSVFIGKHYMLTKPALEAGKMVYVEAPLAASVAEAEELAKLAREKGVRTMVGTQGRGSPAVKVVRGLIASEEIGEVVSSSVQARMAGYASSGTFPVAARFVFDLESPGNSLTIGFHHFYDTHCQVLGPLATYNAHLEFKGGPKSLIDPSTGEIVDYAYPTSPDHIFLQGKLASGAFTSIAWRPNLAPTDRKSSALNADQAEPDHSYFRWIITGSKGEIEITTPDLMWQMTGSATKVWLTKEGQGRKKVEVQKEFGESMSIIAENTAAQYRAFAEEDKERYADFEDAVVTAKVMEELRAIAREQIKKK